MRWLPLLLLATVAVADDAVVARLEWQPSYAGYYTPFPRPLGTTPPEGVALPKLAAGHFGTIDTVVGPIHLALDTATDRLYLDHDFDGDLSDERGRILKQSVRDTVALPLEGAADPVPVSFSLWRQGDDGFTYVPRIHRAGAVELAGRMRRVQLVDGDGDLAFNGKGDHAFLDLDGDGGLTTVRDSHEKIVPGECFAVRGEGFVASVPDAAGARIAFAVHKPAPPPRLRWFDTWTQPPTRAPEAPPAEALADLTAHFADAKGDARLALLAKIAQCGSAPAAKFLAAIAADRAAPPKERQEAIYGLGQTVYAGQETVLARVALAPDEGELLRRAAVWALHRMAAPGREKTFTAVVQDATAQQLLGDAVACLVYVATPSARKAVRRAFRRQPDAGLRRQIYHSATHADQAGLPADLVRDALEDDDDTIQGDALRDLLSVDPGRARAQALRILGTKRKQNLVWWACRVAGFDGDRKAVKGLLQAAEAGDSDTWSLALRLLRPNRDAGGVKEIALGLKHRDRRVRALCASALASIPADLASGAIVQALRREKDTDIITRLVNALANRTDAKAVAELLRVAAQRDYPARSAAVSALTRVGFGDAKVKVFFAKAIVSPHWDDRIYALDAVARAGAVDLAPRVIENLGHKRWEVRLAAVQCLGRVRVGEAIPALIALLGKEEQRRVRVAAADTLFRLTGKEFFDDADGWRRWWEGAREGFAVPASVPRRVVRPGETVATFYGVPVYSERVCFILDRSGSMDTIDPLAEGKMRMERAVDELLGAAGKLRKGARVNVISFADDVTSWKNGLAPIQTAALEKHLKGLEPGGATNLWDALELAFRDDDVDTIYLMTDGAPNQGKFQKDYEILRELRQLNQTRRVAIHCVSVGTDSDLLRQIAKEQSGTYTRR